MAAERIDFLAVIERALLTSECVSGDEGEAVMEALAELIAKADNAATALSNLIAARQVDERYEGVVTDLTAALARIGGTP